MKVAVTVLAIGALVGTTALPALAHDHTDGMGGGGGPGMGMMGGHKHKGFALRAFNNMANGSTYTMMGMEAVRMSPTGWYGGMACYKGLNLGVTAGADIAGHGGLLMGKEFGEGPITFDIGVMLGMGYDLVASPTLTFSGFDLYFVGEPRIGIGWVMSPHSELKLSAGYLASSNMGAAAGPTVTLTFSAIRLGMMRGMRPGPGMGECPDCRQ